MTVTIRGLAAAAVTAALAAGVTIAAPAHADTTDPTWNPNNPFYSKLVDNPAQYNGTIHVKTGDLAITAAGSTDLGTKTTIGGANPGKVYVRSGVHIVNDLSVPVKVVYAGPSDDGTIAPYTFEAIQGWNDVTLQPGEKSKPFNLLVGMPWDARNITMHLTGTFRWSWTITAVPAGPTGPSTEPTVHLNNGLAGGNHWSLGLLYGADLLAAAVGVALWIILARRRREEEELLEECQQQTMSS